MATIDHGSPSQFVGQPWSSWADKVIGNDKKDAPPSMSSGQGDDEVDGSLEVPEEEDAERDKDREQAMKLRIADANVFGLCPTQDEFYLVVCEQCDKVVKPQALRRHMELRHGKPPDKPPDLPYPTEIMHSPPIRIPTTLRAPPHGHAPRTSPLHYGDSPKGVHELLLEAVRPDGRTMVMQAAETMIGRHQPQQEINFDTVLAKQLPGHVVRGQETSVGYSAEVVAASSPPAHVKLTTLDTQGTFSSIIGSPFSSVRVEKMSPQNPEPPGPPQSTIELTPVPTGSIQYAKNVMQHHHQHHHQSPTLLQSSGKPVAPAMVQLAPIQPAMVQLAPIGMMQTVKPALVQPPPIQPGATAGGNLLKLAPARPVQSKKNKKPSPKKNILCKDREFDVNRHCGVWVEADHRPCTRSLTCKTHALSLRRAVKGRRKPFDELLAEHKAHTAALAAANNSQKKMPLVPPPPSPSATTNNPTAGSSKPATPKSSFASRPTTPRSATSKGVPPSTTTPKLSSPKQQLISAMNIKSEQGVKPLLAHQKIMAVPGPVKTYNLNSVLPVNRKPTLVSTMLTDAAPPPPSSSSSSQPSRSSHLEMLVRTNERDKHGEEKSDYSCSHHHPRPITMCSYNARQVGKGLYAFNRRLDHLRSTMAALVEKHTRPPPLKKMCTPSNQSQDCVTPMDITPAAPAPSLQSLPTSQPTILSSASSSLSPSSSAFSFASVSPLYSDGSRTTTTCSSSSSSSSSSNSGSSSIADILKRTKSLPSVVPNNLSSKGLGRKLSKAGNKSLNRSVDGKPTPTSQQHPVKNSKARRKSSSSSGARSNTGTVAQTLYSSASPITLTPTATSTYSVVTNSNLQPGEVVGGGGGGGLVGLDAASIAGSELSGSLLKTLRFVVANIEPNVNGGAIGTAATTAGTPQSAGNFTVPILGNLGSTPVLLGNLGALGALPYDGQLNIKSRAKSAGKSAGERQARRASGAGPAAGIAIHNQPFVEGLCQDNTGPEGSGGLNTCQSLQTPLSNAPSPQIRPNSASPQLPSPMVPNGVIPSPTNITFKPFPGMTLVTAATTAPTGGPSPANHIVQPPQQWVMSPGRRNTPSPGTSSTGDGSAQLLSGSFNTSGKLSLVSPKGSAYNLQKSTLSQTKQSNVHQHHRSASHLSGTLHLQQQQQQQQQQQALQLHQLQLTPQQLQQQLQQISNLVAMDAQGKPLPLSSALIPSLFHGISAQQVGTTGLLPGGLTLTPAVAATDSKVLSQPAVLPQGAIALHLQQQSGSNQPIRLQGPGLADQSQQVGMTKEEDNRQELKMQH